MTLGLNQLGSYRATLKTSFTGTVDGQPQQWTMTSVMVHAQNPPATQFTVETAGTGAPEQPGQVTELSGITYRTDPNQPCAAAVMDGADSIRNTSEPVASLPGVVGADAAGTEAVNGIATEHATFDERALGQAGLTQSTGELWVATGAGYLVKYSLTSKGGAEYFGEGMEGTVTWDYQLSDVDQPVAIAIPADCPAGLVDAPLAPGAVPVTSQPGLLQYRTSAGIPAVMAFYQGKAAGLGWSLTDGPLATKAAGVLGYSTAKGTITIFAQVGAGGTNVFIILERAKS